MKLMKKALMALLIITPFLFAPKTSHAGIIGDIWSWITGTDNTKKDPPPAGNSVPVNEGLVVLVVAGLALGVYMIYSRSRKTKVANSTN